MVRQLITRKIRKSVIQRYKICYPNHQARAVYNSGFLLQKIKNKQTEHISATRNEFTFHTNHAKN